MTKLIFAPMLFISKRPGKDRRMFFPPSDEKRPVPEISRFFGIVIRMFFDDHNPPHFHVSYGDDEALIEINTLAVFAGQIPARVLGLVIEWAALHRQELLDDWRRAQGQEPLVKIDPLQ